MNLEVGLNSWIEVGLGKTTLSSFALCHKKGGRQGHCVCSMVVLWLCSFSQCLAARGQGAHFVVWVLSSFCVVNGIYLQRDRHGIVCLLKEKEEKVKFLCFLSGSL
jgi:hypothetical protein